MYLVGSAESGNIGIWGKNIIFSLNLHTYPPDAVSSLIRDILECLKWRAIESGDRLMQYKLSSSPSPPTGFSRTSSVVLEALVHFKSMSFSFLKAIICTATSQLGKC